MCVSLVQKFNDKELVCLDSEVTLRADGLSDCLEEIDLNKLLELPLIDALPPGY